MKKYQIHPLPIILILLSILLAACGNSSTGAMTNSAETTTEAEASTEAVKSISVWLVNHTGEEISEAYIAPASSEEWGSNLIPDSMSDGDKCQIVLSDLTDEILKEGFDTIIYDAEGSPFFEETDDVFLLEDGDYIVYLPFDYEYAFEVTDEYDRAYYEEIAASVPAAYDPALEPFAGLWRFDNQPVYINIGDGENGLGWTITDVSGGTVKGTIEPSEDTISLYMEDGSLMSVLSRTEDGKLRDSSGQNTFSACEEMVMLPTPEDELSKTISFPDDFSAFSVKYPATLAPAENLGIKNALNFNAVMEKGTDDAYTNIRICFLPIEGYDEYMDKGYGSAQPYMTHMVESFVKSLHGDKLIKSITSDYKDGGDHYSMTSYMWLEGSIFSGDLQQPVRGRLQVRYYGPTKYALIATTIGIESRFQTYCEITDKILESCNYTAGWSTSPKAVPAQPAPKAGTTPVAIPKKSGARTSSSGTAAAAQSDPGDYGSAYYWYDSDGDIWFWNGYENEFMAFGDNGYIDTDGQYYESNDAGWNPQFYYDDYDPWSDAGDTAYEWEEYEFNDYDPQSDSGDYGYAYDWTDEDGDVWSFNGFEDEYIGSGEDYYVEDGQYYENNDDGWDIEYEPEYNDWEPEYNDYDPYSDAGDYGDYYEEDYGGYDDYEEW